MTTCLSAIQTVLKAASFAAEKHARQKRKSVNAEPYINHLVEVANLVAAVIDGPDADLLAAALLHDTMEDTPTTKDELAKLFGADVAGLVEELTDGRSLETTERKRLQVVNAPKKSVRAQLIGLADKISNLRSPPPDWSSERWAEYIAWAKHVVDGMTAPNPILKAEFDTTLEKFGSGAGS